MVRRFEELRQDPFNSRISAPLTNKGDLRKSRIGGWRIIFRVDRGELSVLVLTIDRRGQVYKRM
jgi:mRNA interferase RelE/StbE